MPFDAHSNLGYSTVVIPPAPPNAGTSLTVAAGQGALFPAAPFNCTVWPADVQPLASNAEIVRVTAIVGDTFTIVRAQEGYGPVNISAGYQIANTTSVKVFTDIETAVTAAEGNITTLQGDVATLQTDVAGKLAIAANLSDVANVTTSQQNLGVEPGVDVQAQDQALQDIADATFVQGDVIYRNATNLVRLPPGTAGEFLQTQGAGANPQWATGGGGGDLLAANNLSDVVSASDSRDNLGLEIGVDVQAQDARLQDIADETFAQGDILYYNGTNLVNLGPGTSGQFLQTQGAGANPIWADGGGASDWTTTVIKSADQTVTNNSTLQDDSELFIALETESFYLVQAIILTSGNNTTGDYKWQFAHPNIQGSSPQSQANGQWNGSSASAVATLAAVSGAAAVFPAAEIPTLADGADSYFPLLINFAIRTTGVSGNLQYRFANNAAGVGRTSTTRAGSMLRVQKIFP